MSLKEWLRSANKYAKEGYSKSQVIEELGEPPGRITSNGRGGWKARTGNRKVQDAKRRKFDTTSTPLAAYEAKKLDSTKKEINGKAEMYGLEPTQIEHIADQDDASLKTFGAPGDPDNKLIVKESDARFKDKVKLAVGKNYAVVNNPSEESVKIIDKKYFDPIADPDTLPGHNVRNIDELRRLEAEFQARKAAGANWSKSKSAFTRNIGKGGAILATIAFADAVGRGASANELGGMAIDSVNPIDGGAVADGTLEGQKFREMMAKPKQYFPTTQKNGTY